MNAKLLCRDVPGLYKSAEDGYILTRSLSARGPETETPLALKEFLKFYGELFTYYLLLL